MKHRGIAEDHLFTKIQLLEPGALLVSQVLVMAVVILVFIQEYHLIIHGSQIHSAQINWNINFYLKKYCMLFLSYFMN